MLSIIQTNLRVDHALWAQGVSRHLDAFIPSSRVPVTGANMDGPLDLAHRSSSIACRANAIFRVRGAAALQFCTQTWASCANAAHHGSCAQLYLRLTCLSALEGHRACLVDLSASNRARTWGFGSRRLRTMHKSNTSCVSSSGRDTIFGPTVA